MLHYLFADELHNFPKLAEGMFRDRADQFKTRLGWDVSVDERGEERDRYDALNPLYVLWEDEDGSHGGSMRMLPTTGPVMVNEVFGQLTGEKPIQSPQIWEVTRFCLSRKARPRTAEAIMLGGGEFMDGFDLNHLVGGLGHHRSSLDLKVMVAVGCRSVCGPDQRRIAITWQLGRAFPESCHDGGSTPPLTIQRRPGSR